MIFLDSNIVIYSAQTAFAHLRPYTQNVSDFNWIPELTVFNPL